MNKQQVLQKIKQNIIAKGGQCVKCKFVFKIKEMESMVLAWWHVDPVKSHEEDFSENYSPVLQDVTFRILILMLMVLGFKAKILMWKLHFHKEIFKRKY